LDWEKELEILYLFVLQNNVFVDGKSFDKWDLHLLDFLFFG